MSYLEELLPEFRKGAKIRRKMWYSAGFVHIKDNKIIDEDSNNIHFEAEAFTNDDWEMYQEPINWEYIINNKCLCWFWGDDFERRRAGYLGEKKEDDYFLDVEDDGWTHCRPVRRDEVTFYEGGKDE